MADGESRKPRRGRGRARPTRDAPTEQRPGPEGRPVEQRPGPEGRPVDPRPPAQPSQPAAGVPTRSLHRGASRSEPQRPGDVEQITRRMGAIGIYGDEGPVGSIPASKCGTNGRVVDIVANYFKLTSTPNWCVNQYHVDFSPIVESSRMRRGLLGSHRDVLGGCYIFDGMSDLKSVKKLPNQVTELYSQRKTDSANIRITIKHVTELSPRHPELGRLFNTQMRRNLHHLKFVLIGRHFFDSNRVSTVDKYKLQIWEGVVTSIRMQEEHLMMLVDTSHKVIRDTTGLDILTELYRNCRNNEAFQEQATKEIVGAIVMTRYNNRTYRIEDICWNENPRSTFESKEGPISYMDYYKKQYDVTIKDVRQPLFLCTSKEKEMKGGEAKAKRILLIPELCCVTGLDERMRSNMTMMRELANQTKLDPSQRARNLTAFMGRLNSNQTVCDEMKGWDISFEKNLTRLKGRVLDGEQINNGRGLTTSFGQKNGDFSKDMRGKSMLVAKDLRNWILIFPRKAGNLAKNFRETLTRVCEPMGMRVGNPVEILLDDDRIASYTKAFKDSFKRDLEMAVFLVPNIKKDRYDAIKKLTCLDMPVPSQVVSERTLTRPGQMMSICTKIGIQLNCKLGGIPWSVNIPLGNAMVIGYDTYHDSSRKGHSAGGFVASLDKNFTQWYSRVNFHAAGGWHELSDHLRMNLTLALRAYRDVNGGMTPKHIIFYRDGVGDGQIRYVKEWELKQFTDTLKEVLGDQCRYAFIVVNKRINTRFFLNDRSDYQNPWPGTVVDSVVTRFDRYDFFLISQTARQGTVSPTQYNIIADTTGLKPDHMQRLSFKLTHLYFNWAGTISVPAPCQYAHKLAFLAGQSLHREPPTGSLERLLYYL